MHSVAILAGGDARRFGGRDKSALVVDGRTILERQIAELSTLTQDLRVIRREDDVVPGCGPLGEVAVGCAGLTGLRGARAPARGVARGPRRRAVPRRLRQAVCDRAAGRLPVD